MRIRLMMATLGILMLLVASAALGANEADSTLEKSLFRLGLEVIDSAPVGVVPLELRSLGDLKRFIRCSSTD